MPEDVSVEDHLHQIRRVALDLDEEERELWKQLRRKRDFEDRVAEKRAQLAELADRRRTLSKAHAEAAASVERLSSEVRMAKGVERELGSDVLVLKESNRILHGAFRGSSKATGGEAGAVPPGPSDAENAQATSQLVGEESPHMLQEQIDHLRGHLERLFAEKNSLQVRQQALLDKQRSAEQDRSRLLGALQDDRKRINELRSERIALWEERCAMEREITKMVQEAALKSLAPNLAASRSRWATPPQPVAYQPAFAPPLSGPLSEPCAIDAPTWSVGVAREDPPAVSGGMRVPVVRDAPTSLAAGPSVAGGSSRPASVLFAKDAPRAHWTNFDGGGTSEEPQGGIAQFALGGGITEWADRLRDYRAARASER